MPEFKMPSLGADMDAGRLLQWYVHPGDAVKRGDIVALVDTDKAAIEIEIFEEGVIGQLLVPEGEKVPVGATLAMIQPLGTPVAMSAPAEVKAVEKVVAEVAAAPIPKTILTPADVIPVPEPTPLLPHATPSARKHALELGIDLKSIQGTGKHGVITREDIEKAALAKAKEVEKVVTEVPVAKAAKVEAAKVPPVPSGRVRISPLARRLAEERGLDLSTIVGTGPNGAITQGDVEKAATISVPMVERPLEEKPVEKLIAEKPITKEVTEDRYAGMRRAIAAALGKSKREIPHYYLSTHVDMSKALKWLEEENLKREITNRILPAVLLFKAAALAAKEVPEVNGFWIEGEFKPSEAVHTGIGISLRQGGLIAPAIHDADKKNLDTLMADLRDLVKRARNLQLRSSEMMDATITFTNLGDQGVESVYGIIYPPQVALVGFGRVKEQPWAENGMVGVRPVINITLAADHRASDGHRGGLYLAAIDRFLQTPEAL